MNNTFSRLFHIQQDYHFTTWLFIKLLALVYVIAFASMAVQITGLIGEQGILPLGEMLALNREHFGVDAYWRIPTVFWVNHSDLALLMVCWIGLGFGISLLLNFIPRFSLIALFFLYLSLFHAGQVFLNFQWDSLLLETGFLAILIYRNPTFLLVFLYHFLLFRLRFMSGVSKIISGDPAWANLTTLNYYFETQPLPHIGSWYAHQLPELILKMGTGIVFFMELIVPLFIFLPRNFRLFAALSTIAMQLVIMLTSNHNFINILTIILCLFLLDDRFFKGFVPEKWFNFGRNKNAQANASETIKKRPAKYLCNISTTLIAGFILTASFINAYWFAINQNLHPVFQKVAILSSATSLGSVYHVFPTMQTERQELQIEGSDDGGNWYAYGFKFKPGALDLPPKINLPHQPRLDWMMWFLPPQFPGMNHWFDQFMIGLQENRPEITALLSFNPFEGRVGPRYLRVLAFQYHFTSFEEREKTGHWWQAEFLGVFPDVPPRMP